MKQQPKRAEIWAALAIVYVVWGSTYLGIKLAVRTLPPVLTARDGEPRGQGKPSVAAE